MKAFKFACPVCGQHINADADRAGLQIECPTCFQKIVIPNAPASQEGSLILSATQVRKPRSTTVSESSALAKGSMRIPWKLAFAVGLLLCVGASAFVFRSVIFNRDQSDKGVSGDGRFSRSVTTPPVADASMTYPESRDARWKLDLASVTFIDTPAEGRIHGANFTCDQAYLQNGILTLRQGLGRPSDLSVSIAMRQPTAKWNGNTLVIDPAASPAPPVTLQWKTFDQKTATESFSAGYAMKLEVGKATNGKAPGKIYLCTPDDAKSVVVGTFTIEIRRPRLPQP